MIPQPLHPAVVHFPIALAALLPFAALAALVAIRRGAPRGLWLGVFALSGLVTLSGWAAVQTGENEEEVVERVVSEPALERHEERAKLFLIASVPVLVLMGAGLASGRAGSVARGVATTAALVLLPLSYLAGHSGGALVYEHGAASAYAAPGAGGFSAEAGPNRDHGEERRQR